MSKKDFHASTTIQTMSKLILIIFVHSNHFTTPWCDLSRVTQNKTKIKLVERNRAKRTPNENDNASFRCFNHLLSTTSVTTPIWTLISCICIYPNIYCIPLLSTCFTWNIIRCMSKLIKHIQFGCDTTNTIRVIHIIHDCWYNETITIHNAISNGK